MQIEEEINPSSSVNNTILKDGNWLPKKEKKLSRCWVTIVEATGSLKIIPNFKLFKDAANS